jgi:hypothetical protein
MRGLFVVSLLLGFGFAPRFLEPSISQENPSFAVTVVAQDPSGVPLKNELVIIQDLDHSQTDMARAVTNEVGEISPVRLRPGLYRAIVMAPYTLWKTRILEFLVNDAPVRLVVKLELLPTRGYGDVVPVGARHVHLQVLTSDGHPLAGASVLARDEDATLYLEGWYRTDQSGAVTIETAAKPLVVVVISGKTLVTREFTSESSHETIQMPQQ